MAGATSSDPLAAGRRVLKTEAQALLALEGALDDAFGQAVEAIQRADGRVIVSGMGKSGHIAAKIAATMASTGTPAQFVHPAEASHGDLGMVTGKDVVLLLSNSGETAELADMIAHTRENGISLIGMAGRAGSTLLSRADVGLLLPDAPEACLVGLAPTTSTTMMLALGDALAVALMEQRGFTPEDYRLFHPGGRLGARLARVRELMHAGDGLPIVDESWPMSDVLLEITQKGLGLVAVVNDDGHLSGVITDGDLRRHMSGLLERQAAEVMTKSPLTIGPDDRAADGLLLMNETKRTALIVCAPDDPTPRGVLHIHDCLRAGLD